MATVETSLDDLLDSLAFVLARNLPLLSQQAAKPKHIPSDELCRSLARLQVDHLKLSGVEKVIRRVASQHSWPPKISKESVDV